MSHFSSNPNLNEQLWAVQQHISLLYAEQPSARSSGPAEKVTVRQQRRSEGLGTVMSWLHITVEKVIASTPLLFKVRRPVAPGNPNAGPWPGAIIIFRLACHNLATGPSSCANSCANSCAQHGEPARTWTDSQRGGGRRQRADYPKMSRQDGAFMVGWLVIPTGEDSFQDKGKEGYIEEDERHI